MSDARQIYQRALDRMTDAILARDAAAFAEQVIYPYEVRVMDGSIICRDDADLARSVDNFAEQLARENVTKYTRVCDSAKFVEPDYITGHHTTRVSSDGKEVLAPYVTRMKLYRTRDGSWRASLSDTALRSADWQLIPEWVDATSGATFGKPVSEGEKRLKHFQTILDRVSAAFLSDDAEAWVNAVSLPLQLVTRQGIQTFHTADELRSDFAVYRNEFKTHGVTDIIREAKTAELIDGDQMVGTFRTHFLNGAKHVVPPWDASVTLRREDSIWRVTTVMRAIGHFNWAAISGAEIEDIPQDTPKKGDPQ